MRIRVLYFQTLRQMTGQSEEVMDLPGGCTADALLDAAIERH
ncbi:molybdopterin synthase sulfur carrier subunit, partial [Candidatus Poribacteria bacterium]|nr:molybdopterin synthase sulfur carrier subunit [Candidatus Poribacteria bacterium]